MRHSIWLAAGLLVLLCTTSAKAQNNRRSIFFGIDPTTIVNVPVDTSNSSVPIASPVQRPTRFRILDFFPKVNISLGRTIFGQSIFPTEAELPGAEYLKAFRLRRARPVGQ